MTPLRDLVELFSLASMETGIDGSDVLDICGTGGDGLNTFNISTASAIVCASVGCKVVKHCGGSVSSTSGSTEVLDKLGYTFGTAKTGFDEHGFMCINAAHFNPLLREVGKVRKKLGRATVINQIAPLLNPVSPAYRVIGTRPEWFNEETADLLARVTDRGWLICADDGMDEISTVVPTSVYDTGVSNFLSQSHTRHRIVPQHYGYTFNDIDPLVVKGPTESAYIIQQVLKNKGHEQQIAAVVLNAAAGICVSGKVYNYDGAIEIAKYAIKSGLANAKLQQIIK